MTSISNTAGGSPSATGVPLADPFSDEGAPPNLDKTVVIGCGNILRGDDAVGPTLIRHLWAEGGIPDDVTLVDGGTAGMDVAFKMRGAAHVILIDAAQTGAQPGTTYRIPGSEIEELPELQALSSHSFRWDHSLAFAHWLLGGDYPREVTVFLIEVASCEPGAELTEPVATAMYEVADLVRALYPASDPVLTDRNTGQGSGAGQGSGVEVEITDDGNLRIDAGTAQRLFPADALVAVPRGRELWLIPLTGPEGGGLLLKQRNPAGDRSTLIWEALPPDAATGRRDAHWDDTNGALRVDLGLPQDSDPSATGPSAPTTSAPP